MTEGDRIGRYDPVIEAYCGKNFRIHSETPKEKEILSSREFNLAANYGNKRKGHPEGTIGSHIEQILTFIDKLSNQERRNDLRLLAQLHDLGKYKVTRSENGHVIGKGHSLHSYDIATNFIPERQDLLDQIAVHDKYFHFYKDSLRGKNRDEKFIKTYSRLDLDTLIRFNYADSNNRERDSVMWFDDECVRKDLLSSQVYKLEPEVLE